MTVRLAPLVLARVGGGTLRTTAPLQLLFFFDDAEPSARDAAKVARLADELQADGLTVVGVARLDEGEAAAFAAERGLGSIDLCVDPPPHAAATTAEVQALPCALLVVRGEVRARARGAQGWDELAGEALRALDGPSRAGRS